MIGILSLCNKRKVVIKVFLVIFIIVNAAMSCALPMVSTVHGAVAEIILDNNRQNNEVGLGEVKATGQLTETKDKPTAYKNSFMTTTDSGASFQWTPNIPAAGIYKVFMWWDVQATRPAKLQVEVNHADGTDAMTVNQTEDGGQWNEIGIYRFNVGNTGYVKATNSEKYPCFDAVKFEYVGDGNTGSGIEGNTGSRVNFSDITDAGDQHIIGPLVTLGILNGYEDKTFRPEDTISRAEFAAAVTKLMGLGVSEDNDTLSSKSINFSDVQPEHWAKNYINLAVGLGFINGYTDGKFEPDNPVTFEEAVKILVCVLGYEPYALTKGGYPTGYLIEGEENHLLKGVTGKAGEPITRMQVARLINNALTVDLLQQTTYGNDPSLQISSGKNLLTERLKIKKLEGQITGVHTSSLFADGGFLNEDEVAIDGVAYKVKGIKADDLEPYFGQKVVLYVEQDKTDNEDYIIWTESDQKEEEVVTVDAGDLQPLEVGSSLTHFSYFKNTDNDATDIHLSDSAHIIYNGRPLQLNRTLITSSDVEYLVPKIGNIKFIDNDGDGKFDIVLIYKYDTMIVSSTYQDGDDISVFDKKYSGLSEEIYKNDNNTYCTVTDSTGSVIDASKLREWDVLSVAKSLDDKVKKIFVSRKTVEGSVYEISEDREEEVTINGTAYKVNDTYMKDSIGIGYEGKFHLDAFGNIVALESETTSAQGFGYILEAGIQNGLSKTIQFKMLDNSGNIVMMNGVEQPVIDNYKCRDGIEAINRLCTNFNNVNTATNQSVRVIDAAAGAMSLKNPTQPMRYTLDGNGKIQSVDTPYTDIGADESVDTLHVMTPGYMDNYLHYNGVEMFVSTQTLTVDAIDVICKKETPVFFVSDSTTIDEKAFRKLTAASFGDQSKYNVIPYVVSNSTSIPDLFVRYYNQIYNPPYKADTLAMVNKITTFINAEGEKVKRLYGLKNGKEFSIDSEDGTVSGTTYENILDTVQPGDIIRYATTSDGKFANQNDPSLLQRFYSVSQAKAGHNIFDAMGSYLTRSATDVSSVNRAIGINADSRVLAGYVYSREGSYIMVTPTNLEQGSVNISNVKTETYQLDKFKVYIYDDSKEEGKKFRVGSLKDIVTYQDAGSSCSKVFIYTFDDYRTPKDLVILKF